MSHNASAVQYGSAAKYPIRDCVSAYQSTSGTGYMVGSVYNEQCNMSLGSSLPGATMQSMSIVFNSTIPANSLITIDMTINGLNTFYGLTVQGNQTIISQDFERYTDGGASTFHIHTTFYTSAATNNLAFSSPIGWLASGATVKINHANVVLLFAPITTDQIALLQQKLNSIDANIVIGDERLSYIYNEIKETNDAQQQQIEKENQSLENIDSQSAGDISGTDNQNTTNLINLFGSFVSAVGSASATNCNFAADFGNLDLGNLNFCRDNPPQFIQIIGSIILIALFVPLAYMLVNRIIAEIRSFTNG